jgi:uncharacterized membrane protein (DUF485 family)
MKYQNKQDDNSDLYLSKFAKGVGRLTGITFLAFYFMAMVDGALDTFFLSWPLLGSLVALSGVCLFGFAPMWLIVGILYIIEVNKESNSTGKTEASHAEPEVSYYGKIGFKMFFTLLGKKLKKHWLSLSKKEKEFEVGATLYLLPYISGSIIQISQPEGKRNVIAAILVVVGLVSLTFIYTKLVMYRIAQRKEAMETNK